MNLRLDNLADAPVPVLFLIVIVLAMITAGVVMLFSRRKKPTLLVFNNENGRVEISRAAIHKVVQRTCERFREVGRARSRLRQSKGHIHVKVRLMLGVRTQIQEISNHLQKQIARVIRDDLGIKNLGRVTVVVEGFIPQAEPERSNPIRQSRVKAGQSSKKRLALSKKVLSSGPGSSPDSRA